MSANRLFLLLYALIPLLGLPSTLFAQTTTRASVNSSGDDGIGSSRNPSISDDGRFVAFESTARHLVPNDTNFRRDVFVHDRVTGNTERLSIGPTGVEGDDDSRKPSISGNGRYVVFQSDASNLTGSPIYTQNLYLHDRQTGLNEVVDLTLQGMPAGAGPYSDLSQDGRYIAFESYSPDIVPGDTNQRPDIFVLDRVTGITERVSIDSAGIEGNQYHRHPAISGDGRFVTFSSNSTNLVPGDTNLDDDVFLHDRLLGTTERISIDSAGNQSSGGAERAWPDISHDGSRVVYSSEADDLVPGDTNRSEDIFVWDRHTRTTRRVSLSSSGEQSTWYSWYPAISGDGNHVSFRTATSNFAPDDWNWRPDIFVHDLRTGATRRVSLSSIGSEGDDSAEFSDLSFDGRYVAFNSAAENLVPGPSLSSEAIYLRDRWDGEGSNSFHLAAPSTASAGTPIPLVIDQGESFARFLVRGSFRDSGSIVRGHGFDLGSPNLHVGGGFLDAHGAASLTVPTAPAWAGHTLYLEVGALKLQGVLFDSNLQAVTFQ